MQPLWKWLPAELAHQLAPLGLSFYSSFFGSEEPEPWDQFSWQGLIFPNRIGIAGGVDKNAQSILDWQRVGAGFVEVGTLTPQPQAANLGTILARDWDRQILWNKMGFPNLGLNEAYYNLLSVKSEAKIPIFVNIGKNRATANQDAYLDYKLCAEKLAATAAALVINVSSPNTSGLRALQDEDQLKKIITAVKAVAGRTPLLIKLSPDQTAEELENSLMASYESGADGFILTNTTLARTQETSNFPKDGGLSGMVLVEKSRLALQQAISILGPRRQGLLLVSTGGILDKEEVQARLKLGADLVQVYSALVFHGPGFFRQLARGWHT